MENLKVLNTKLRDALIAYYTRHDCKIFTDASAFEQQQPYGKARIMFGPQAEHTSTIIYTPTVGIVHDDIKTMLDSIFGPSLGFNMNALLGRKSTAHFMGSSAYDEWEDYRLSTESDIPAIIAHHQTFMENVGWAFIKKMDTRGISEWLNTNFFSLSATMSEEEKIALIRRTGLHDATNGITAAWIANDTRRYQLIENYRTVFFLDHLRAKIDQLVEGLKKNTA